jgi:hypothetical protein
MQRESLVDIEVIEINRHLNTFLHPPRAWTCHL